MANNKHQVISVPVAMSTNLDNLKIQGNYLNANDGYITNGTLAGFEKRTLPYSNLIVDPVTNDSYYLIGKDFFKNDTILKTFSNFGVTQKIIGVEYLDWYSEVFFLEIRDREIVLNCNGKEYVILSDVDRSSTISTDLHLHKGKTYVVVIAIEGIGLTTATLDINGDIKQLVTGTNISGINSPKAYISSFDTYDYIFISVYRNNTDSVHRFILDGDGETFKTVTSTGTDFYYNGKQVLDSDEADNDIYLPTKHESDLMYLAKKYIPTTFEKLRYFNYFRVSLRGVVSVDSDTARLSYEILDIASSAITETAYAGEDWVRDTIQYSSEAVINPYAIRTSMTLDTRWTPLFGSTEPEYYTDTYVADTNWMYLYTQLPDSQVFNAYGSRAFSNNWCLHHNNGGLSGVSVAEEDERSGNLIEGWNIWDTDFIPKITSDSLVLKKPDGNIIQLYRNNSIKADLWGDRFIVFNTVDYSNAFDIQTQTFTRYAADYSNTCIPHGLYISDDYTPETPIYFTDGSTGLTTGYEVQRPGAALTFANVTAASGYNVNPENTLNPLIGLSVNPIYGNTGADFSTGRLDMRGIPSKGDVIDTYASNEILSVAPPYIASLENNTYNIRGALEGTVFPIGEDGNIQYNIGMGAEIVSTTTNADIVRIGDRSYPLIYQNLAPLYGYTLLSFVENVDVSFSIYGTSYSIVNDKITLVTYNGGVISSTTTIVDVSGLTFMGFDPNTAYFFNNNTKYIYTFTGDRVLQPLQSASSVNSIIGYSYNPATTVLSVLTDIGIINLSGGTVLSVLPFENGTKVLTTDNSIILETDIGVTAQYTYNQANPGNILKFSTPFVGIGGPTVCVIDCWYLRIYSENKNTVIKSKITTLTDGSTTSEEKVFKLKPSEFDDFGTAYLRIQPKYQRCIAAKLDLEISDGSIATLSYGISSDGTSQITRYNI